jgi:hypothetical protein
MASLADLFNPTFFMFLGILVLVAALLVVYFETKIREQNHKVASMLSLVSTLAEETNGIKMGMNHLAMTSFGGSGRFFQQSVQGEYDQTGNLHEDADNEEDEDEDDEDEDEESHDEKKKENNLISVSDDSDDSETESYGSELDSVSDDSDDDIIEELLETNDDDVTSHNDIKVLKLNITNDLFENNEHTKEDLEDVEDLEVLEVLDSQSVELNDCLVLAEETNEENLITSDFKTININLEESTNSESLDYKKLSLPKLRSIVAEKGLSTDSSKLKKQDLLKLLGVE